MPTDLQRFSVPDWTFQFSVWRLVSGISICPIWLKYDWKFQCILSEYSTSSAMEVFSCVVVINRGWSLSRGGPQSLGCLTHHGSCDINKHTYDHLSPLFPKQNKQNYYNSRRHIAKVAKCFLLITQWVSCETSRDSRVKYTIHAK